MLGHVNGQKHPALCARFDWPVWCGLCRWKRALEYSDPSCQMKGLELSPCARPLRPGKGGRRPSAQEKLKSRQPGGLTGVFAQDSVPSRAPCAQQTLRGALQGARSSPLWAPCRPGRTPRRDHSSPGDAQLRSSELRGELCWDVWLKSDDSVFRLHQGQRFASHPGQPGRGTSLRLCPLGCLSYGNSLTVVTICLIICFSVFFLVIFNQASAP